VLVEDHFATHCSILLQIIEINILVLLVLKLLNLKKRFLNNEIMIRQSLITSVVEYNSIQSFFHLYHHPSPT
jgi:hypothetical protein